MYFNYHAKAMRLIREGHCTHFELVERWNQIAPVSYTHLDVYKRQHLTLTCGRPLTKAKTLVDQHGDFLKNTQFYKVYVDPAEVEAEFRAQIEKFIELFGRRPTHLDCHQGCYDGQTLTMARVGGIGEEHNTEEILAVTLALAKEYQLPMRRHCE